MLQAIKKRVDELKVDDKCKEKMVERYDKQKEQKEKEKEKDDDMDV